MSSSINRPSRSATKVLIAVSMAGALIGLPSCGGPSEVGTVKVVAPKGAAPAAGTPEAGAAGNKPFNDGNPSVDPKVIPKGNPRDPANGRSIKNRPMQ